MTNALTTDFTALIRNDFRAYDPAFDQQEKWAGWRLERRRLKLNKLELQYGDMECSEQIYIEAKWLMQYTADFKRFGEWLTKLDTSFKKHDQPGADVQDPKTGAFGLCYSEWFLHMDAMITAVNDMYDNGTTPEYPFLFMAPIETPELISKTLTPLITSNIAKNGVDNRDAIGAITGAMSQLVYKSYLRKFVQKNVKGFELTPEYIAAYTEFLDNWQDPETGFWGGWYESGGKLYKSPDLSLTFHTVSYRKGKVNMIDQLVETLFAIKEKTYPFGWLWDGHFNNHNNYDVVKMFKLLWDDMTPNQQNRASLDMEEMISWCLRVSLQPDGSFKPYPKFYNSLGAAFYYGVAFLNIVGYFGPEPPFWRENTFPEGQDTCRRIRERLTQLGLDDPSAQAAMQILDQDCPCTPGEPHPDADNIRSAKEHKARAHAKRYSRPR